MRQRLAVAGVVLTLSAGLSSTAFAAEPTLTQTCAAAQALTRLGRDADAQKLYLELVEHDYSCAGAAPALHPSWPRRVTQFVSAWWSFALYAALVVGFVCALATRYHGVRTAIRRFPIVGRTFEPRVSTSTFDSSADGTRAFGQAATSLLNNGLRRLAGDSLAHVDHIAVSTGVESTSATVGQLGDLGAQFKALSAVMGFLGQVISIPRYQLAGTLQPDGGEGLGLTLTLDRRSRAVDATTLWVRPTHARPAVDAFQTLALLGAAWVEYAMRKDELPNEFEFTPSPKSYAYFRLGVLRTLLDYPETFSEEAYRAALDHDRSNVGALLNLAVLLRRTRDDAHTKEAQELLDRAFVALEKLPEPKFKFIWYQVLYSRVALLLNRAADGNVVDPEKQTDERTRFFDDSASMLMSLGYLSARRRWPWHPRFPERRALSILMRRYGWRGLLRWHRPPPRGFARFLFENAEPNAILFALWDIQPPETRAPPRARGWTLPRLVECVRELAGQDRGVRSAHARAIFERFVYGTGASPRMLGWTRRRMVEWMREVAGKEPDVRYAQARAIVERFVYQRRPLSYRTKYNLACYYATRKAPTEETPTELDLKRAEDCLGEALEDAPALETVLLARRAESDPTLKSLRASGKKAPDATAGEPTRLEAVLAPFSSGVHDEGDKAHRVYEDVG